MTNTNMTASGGDEKTMSNAAHYDQLDASLRAAMARRLGERFGQVAGSDFDIGVARDFLMRMVKDAAVQVRQSLVETLKANPRAPRDVVKALAEDEDLVALPILRFSEVLTENDLVEILNTTEAFTKMTAIAGRKGVSTRVTDILCERGDAGVVTALLENTTADVSPRGYAKAVDRVGHDEAVQMALVRRPAVSLEILDRILVMMSDQLRRTLVSDQKLSAESATAMLFATQHRLTIGLATSMPDAVVDRLTAGLFREGRLSDDLLVRAVCMANLQFFESAIAARALVSTPHAREVLQRGTDASIGILLRNASLPEKWAAFVIKALGVLRQSLLDTQKTEVADYQAAIMERIISFCADQDPGFAEAEMDYLLSRIQGPPTAA
jgi:uncharacterized protein (DUF2336 family)